MLLLSLVIIAFTGWLGLYLVQRESDLLALRWIAIGLLAYTTVLTIDLLRQYAPEDIADPLYWLIWPLFIVPIVCWLWALRAVVPRMREKRMTEPRFPYALAILASLFFGLGLGILLLPLEWLPRSFVMAGLGFDLLLFGYAIAVLDAFDQGESLLPDMTRSYVSALLVALLFGSQVGLVMLVTGAESLATVGVLVGVVLSAISIVTLAAPLQSGIDSLVFASLPGLRSERAALRETEQNLPRALPAIEDPFWDAPDFERMTRRALSHMSNLPRLAASPLIRLPVIDHRFTKRDVDGFENTLLRSAELKQILTEAILRLKPEEDVDFRPTDAWRSYNALYFPYVRGLKPYSRRAIHEHADSAQKEALDWFRVQVPERTLYNWQTAAAALIAQDLREQVQGSG